MKVVVLTGAGISAESGVPTFRDSDGLWEGHDVMEVATPEGFAANPVLVQRFYDLRRAHLAKVEPNAAHVALARLEESLGDDLLVITQNVDDLHERAGSTRVLHMHGELLSALCLSCGARFPWETDLSDSPPCPACGESTLRPDVVWFGEIPYRMDEALQALQEADLFVAVGTSAQVQPAAAFVHWAAEQGARTLEINLAGTISTDDFDESRQGRAGDLLPQWVEELLAEG
ncbi:NAD-dependent deacylase [Nocardioides jishulii]|uniref:NAD-dependent protein deacylase n=1 Tax=Nocardioides jishulii TaxID=2575440 RepID=A0A4U2YS24_9ACTN|nr:NAD-dependent deacylase [Nocardioides jishulii]QCX28885.1 NAD-dependent deacylase [Nocardioides jishulii]TKI64218.1 NAD-dependent deacylase [Nocardioides jishulii]